MLDNALILFGSRSGTTRDISAYMTYLLNKHLISVDAIDLTHRSLPLIDLDLYDIIIVGSSIKFGRWCSNVLLFLHDNRDYISSFPDRFNIFAVSGEAADPNKREKAKKKYIDQILDKIELPELHNSIFSGQLNFSNNTRLNWFDRQYYRLKILLSTNSISYDLRGNNDFRDWDDIAEFVYEIPVPVTNRSYLSAYR